MSRFVRAPRLLWRVAVGRVLVRRITPRTNPVTGTPDETMAADLLGAAALVWVAAEIPLTAAAIAADTELPDSVVDAAITELLASGWLVHADTTDTTDSTEPADTAEPAPTPPSRHRRHRLA